MNPDFDPIQDPRFADLLDRLRAQPPPAPSSHFTEAVMAHFPRTPIHSRIDAWLGWRKVAAIVVILIGVTSWIYRQAPEKIALSSIDLLMATQRSDGSWSADAESLNSRYDTGVTALALLAIIQTESVLLEGPQRKTLEAGIGHLIRQLSSDGRFGDSSSRVPFTPYLAGMALQAAAQLPHAREEWKRAAAQAAPHLPPGNQMAKLNQTLSHPDSFPSRWADAGGPVAVASIELLSR
ncbi:MAG: hypothetical protein KAH24_04310 [Holophagae bacterium]|nr:hypothetical protein [Holophagae bacterium]